MDEKTRQETREVVEQWKGDRSRKRLKCTTEVTAHQKEAFRHIKERMAQGEPVTWVYIGTPLPVLQAMDILFINSVNYGAVCSAKQLSRYYFDRLNNEGYFRDLCRYCTVPLGYAFDKKPEIAPWGGLPKFAAAIGWRQDDPVQKIFEIYAREFNIPLFLGEINFPLQIPPYQNGLGKWEYTDLEQFRIDMWVEEFEHMIRFLETTTGKSFSLTRLREICEFQNQINEYYGMATNLAGETVPCPISWTDALSLVANFFSQDFQFQVDIARKYYEEIKERVDNRVGACEHERVRLRYWGHPVWFSLGFYNHFEDRYGTVFLPCYYYEGSEYAVLHDLSDPLRALAAWSARIYPGAYRTPPTNIKEWHLHISKRYKADGVIFMLVESCKLLYASVLFGRECLEKAGIPTLEINADMVDARDWDDTKMKSLVASFIETIMS